LFENELRELLARVKNGQRSALRDALKLTAKIMNLGSLAASQCGKDFCFYSSDDVRVAKD
jgi:hypothetical protein